MTATQLRYRRYLKQTRSTLAIAELFREYPQFTDCEFTFTARSVTLASETLGFLERGPDIGNADVEEHVALVGRAPADTTRDPGSVACCDAVHEAVILWLRHGRGYRRAGVELPAEQFAEVAAEPRWIFPDDLEVHNWLPHDPSLPAGNPATTERGSCEK